ncbi:MAG: hypothetical protein ACOVOQ_12965 [Flavobacterium sp.]
MAKAQVRATFIPNGFGSGNKLKYSIYISIDYATLGNEPSLNEALTYPAFINATKFTLLNGTSPIAGSEQIFDCKEAQHYWDLMFKDNLKKSIQLLFKETDYLKTFQSDSELAFIPNPLEVINHFQSHYTHRILNKIAASDKSYFGFNQIQSEINKSLTEINTIKELIKGIHQNPNDTANTYDKRMQNADKVHISEIISFLSNYPILLRKFGLLYTYEIDSTLITDGAEIKVQFSGASSTVYEVASPIPTVVYKNDNLFIAQTKKTEVYKNGMLNLQQQVSGKKRFSVVQNTAVEAAFKTDAYLKEDKEAVPPIQTNGIYLIDNFREQEKDELNSSTKAKLYLEDILTGFRFDLKNVTPKSGEKSEWKSLNRKKSTYTFSKDSKVVESITDDTEGWTNTDTKAKTKLNGNDKEVVADILLHINGWGLNSKNPLQEEAQKVKAHEKNEDFSKSGGTGDPVHDFLTNKFSVTSISPKSSLHPLRVGFEYQLRARLVTIDGYSITSQEANDFTKDDLRTSDFKFCRLESIGAPVFVLKHTIYEGDGCDEDKKVRESKRGESEYILAIRSNNNSSKTNETTERGLAPASISWHLAEWQGSFDTEKKYADTDKLKRSKNYLPQIIEKGGKKYWKERTGKFKANGDTNRSVPYIIDPLSQSFEILCDENAIYSLLYCENKDLNFWEDRFDWWKVKTWEIIVKEQRKRQSPGTIRGKNCVFSIDSWNKTITILIAKGEDLKFKIRTFPKFDCSTQKSLVNYPLLNDHLIATLLEPSNMVTMNKTEVETFHVKRKDVFFNSSNNKTVLIREQILFAEKEFRVVHAVKKPLFNPKFVGNTVVQRTWNPDETSFALLTSTIFYSGKTSKKLELFGTWTDKIDDEKSQNLIPIKFENVFIDEYKLNGLIEKPMVIPNGSDNYILGEIEDYGQPIDKTIILKASAAVTVFNKVHYCDSSTAITITLPPATNNKGKCLIFKNRNSGIATLQPVSGATIDGENNKTLNIFDKIQIESNGVNWVLKDIPPIYADTEKTFYAKHNLGDSKHRVVEYKLKATSRFTEFFSTPKDEKSDDFSVYSEQPLKLSIPSSQAPVAPKVAFIIPYFEWEFTGNEKRRKGNRLRVYIERPWFSSGEGEKLAVIISNSPKYDSEKNLYQFISKWGRDVTTLGRNLLPLTPKNFANKVTVENSLTLNNLLFKKRAYDKSKNEITNTIERPFSAIVYDVELDRETNNWYADIEFEDVNAYFPFIQLSLARYQKDSIADEELSSSILCDFIQVAPTRTISYHKQGDYIELNLFGSVYKADYDSSKGKAVVKNEVYITFIPKENSQESNNDILYSLNDDTPNKYDWKKVEDYTILENGIVWKFKDISPFDNYTVLVKEFEIFGNILPSEFNPEKNPTKRLTFGDSIDF